MHNNTYSNKRTHTLARIYKWIKMYVYIIDPSTGSVCTHMRFSLMRRSNWSLSQKQRATQYLHCKVWAKAGFSCVCVFAHIYICIHIYTYILTGSYKVQYCNNSSNKNKSYWSVNRLHTIRILILWLSSAVNWRWRKSANRVARHLHMHVCIYLSAHLHLCTYICGKALGDEFRGGILL